MNEQVKKTKVYVGLSGGVDSAVSAALLKQAGYDVTGVFIEVWQPEWIECNWREDRRDAMRVAAALDIPFVNLNLREEYKKGVIDYMIDEYKAGRTPNPDVMCNREVKFGAFWQWAKKNGAAYVATGHYAQNIKNNSGLFELRKSADANKDQSYFLWTLNQDDLEHILFPVGHLEKPDVRKLAEKFGLPNFDKKDSQGLCFIGKIDIKEFLAHYLKPVPGKVLDENGKVIGHHNGALFFTIGERHGFTISEKSDHSERLFVISKNMKDNTITVSAKSHADQELHEKLDAGVEIKLENVNWSLGKVWVHTYALGKKVEVRSRYRQELANATVTQISDPHKTVQIRFEQPQDSLTPGQSLVMYAGETCIGGGIISEVL